MSDGNPLVEAAAEVQDLCQEHSWRFCFIGGLAVLRWGEPRMTRDVDLTLIAAFGDEHRYVDVLLDRLEARLDDARTFGIENRVVLARATNGVPVDVALGALPFEQRTVDRASAYPIAGRELITCSAEDLVVHKVFAGRTQDWLDVEGIVARQGGHLDRDLIEGELEPLLEVIGSPERLDRLTSMIERD